LHNRDHDGSNSPVIAASNLQGFLYNEIVDIKDYCE